jgi:hypothetical protein
VNEDAAKETSAPKDPAGAVEVSGGAIDVGEILAVRRGPGANCSSIGSALDLLFLSSVAAGVVLAAIAASFGDEERAERERETDAEANDESAR